MEEARYPQAAPWKVGSGALTLLVWGLPKTAFAWDTEEGVVCMCAIVEPLVLLPHIPREVRMQGDWQALLKYNFQKVRNVTRTNI